MEIKSGHHLLLKLYPDLILRSKEDSNMISSSLSSDIKKFSLLLLYLSNTLTLIALILSFSVFTIVFFSEIIQKIKI
ncbi:MAG TPA: hypothetical protein VN704_09850 [Verrucomicrobiae bacterium]|nr:hypothetical protein [Verrucomicrobiae bacterium]